MCVYHKDNAEDFRVAVESIYNHQTLKPAEVVIVTDGPVSGALDAYISSLENSGDSFKIIRLPENLGHAGARRAAFDAATNEYIAIMDADDISLPDRFEKTMAYLARHPEVCVIGGQIEEFVGEPDNVVGKREVPCRHDEILQRLKGRCPFNQVTVTMSRTLVAEVGGYMDWYCEEDYYLWLRLALARYKFANLPDTLVKVRVGEEMYQRRGGWKYFSSEARLQGFMLRKRIISLPRYCYNVLGRFAIQVAMPNKLRGFIFQKLFRK